MRRINILDKTGHTSLVVDEANTVEVGGIHKEADAVVAEALSKGACVFADGEQVDGYVPTATEHIVTMPLAGG